MSDRNALEDVMNPIINRHISAPFQFHEAHQICQMKLAELAEGNIPARSIPRNTPVIFDGRYFAPVVVAQFQYNKFATFVNEDTGRRADFRCKPEYLPPPIWWGVVLAKPHIKLIPLPGVTPENWREIYPPFHMNDVELTICVGRTFKIGDVTDLNQEIGRLVELLSWVNMTDPMYRLSNAAIDMPNTVWAKWSAAASQIQAGHPERQDVFVPITTLSFDGPALPGAVLHTEMPPPTAPIHVDLGNAEQRASMWAPVEDAHTTLRNIRANTNADDVVEYVVTVDTDDDPDADDDDDE